MDFSPKLRRVIQEIEKILQKEDIAGIVVLHLPGYSEFTVKLDPSYSCITVNGNKVHFRSKLEDYGFERKCQAKKRK